MSSRVQFDLFGVPIAAPSADAAMPREKKSTKAVRVELASLDVAVVDIAARLSLHVHLGTSSWSFPGWSNLGYAALFPDTALASHGLPAYAAHPLMRTVGIDRTFYAPIGEADFRNYAVQARTVSPAFRFLVKAPMLFTGPRLRSDDGRWSDNVVFLDASLASAQFVLPATRGLLEMCGPLVFQFPTLGPRYTRSPARFADAFAEFLLAFPVPSGAAFYAVEVRDPELLTDDYLAALWA